MSEKKVFGTKQIVTTAVLLAICIISQFFKNTSIFITGPVINACLVIALLAVNLPCAVILAVITPITAWIIAASPVMTAVPVIILFIMGGNIVLVIASHFLFVPQVRDGVHLKSWKLWLFGLLCPLLKGAFMGLTISLWLLPTFIPSQSPLRAKLSVFQTTFSVYQFITAAIGMVYAVIIWAALRKYLTNPDK